MNLMDISLPHFVDKDDRDAYLRCCAILSSSKVELEFISSEDPFRTATRVFERFAKE